MDVIYNWLGSVLAILGIVYGMDAIPRLQQVLTRSLAFGLAGALAAAGAGAILILPVLVLIVVGVAFHLDLDPVFAKLAVQFMLLSILFLVEAGMIIGLTLGLMAHLKTKPAESRHRNRLLASVGVTLVCGAVALGLLLQRRGSPAWLGLVVIVMVAWFILGALVDRPPATTKQHIRFSLVVLALFAAAAVERLAVGTAAGAGPGPLRVADGLVVLLGMTLGLALPAAAFGYVLANRSNLGAVTTTRPPVLPVAVWWLIGLATGLVLLLATQLLPRDDIGNFGLNLLGVAAGLLIAVGHGQGRRILAYPRLRSTYDPRQERFVVMRSGTVAWRRFRNGLLVAGSYTYLWWALVLVALFLDDPSGFEQTARTGGLPGSPVVVSFPTVVIIGWFLLASPLATSVPLGALVGVSVGWGPYAIDRIRRLQPRTFSNVGAVIAIAGVLVTQLRISPS